LKVYLDTSVIVPFLYGELTEPARFAQMERLFGAIENGQIVGVLSFYAFHELYEYLAANYPADDISDGFRYGLLELLRFPLIIVSHLDRTESNRLRRRFTIADPYDALHVATAMLHNCDTIVTYDDHFQAVADLITVLSPEQILARIAETAEDDDRN
jgi:predicted nucleic acid-binding protein